MNGPSPWRGGIVAAFVADVGTDNSYIFNKKNDFGNGFASVILLLFSTVCYNDFTGGMVSHFDQIDSRGDCIITDAAT